mgnify:CR=1 FL=1
MKEILLKAENVRAYYKLEKVSVKAVDGLSFEILEDEVIGVVGESGCGKTTLSNVIFMNMVKPLTLVDGKIFLRVNGDFVELSSMTRDEVKRKFWGKEITIIPQAAMNALMPTIRMEKYVRHLAESHGIDEEELLEKARRRFEEVGLDPLWIKRYPFELSGGMRQRVMIAMALACHPKLLIADEPTSALDVTIQAEIIDLLDELRKSLGSSIVFISHDLALLAEISDRIMVMYAGKVVELGDKNTIISEPKHPYTKAILESINYERKSRLKAIRGSIPSLINPPRGCRFHPRCPFAMERCSVEEPRGSIDVKGRIVYCHLYEGGGDGGIKG